MNDQVIHAVVKRTSPRRKQAHVILPEFLAGRYVEITLLDGTDKRLIYARASGKRGAHAYVDKNWIGEPVRVRVMS